MSKQVCSICRRPQHFGTCEQARKIPKKVVMPRGFLSSTDKAMDAAIERGERLEKIARTIERLSKGCQCMFCKNNHTTTIALAKILKLAKGA